MNLCQLTTCADQLKSGIGIDIQREGETPSEPIEWNMGRGTWDTEKDLGLFPTDVRRPPFARGDATELVITWAVLERSSAVIDACKNDVPRFLGG